MYWKRPKNIYEIQKELDKAKETLYKYIENKEDEEVITDQLKYIKRLLNELENAYIKELE